MILMERLVEMLLLLDEAMLYSHRYRVKSLILNSVRLQCAPNAVVDVATSGRGIMHRLSKVHDENWSPQEMSFQQRQKLHFQRMMEIRIDENLPRGLPE